MQIANEMAMLCLVEHPFVVSIQAVSQDSMYTYLVMDLAPGGSSLPRVEQSFHAFMRQVISSNTWLEGTPCLRRRHNSISQTYCWDSSIFIVKISSTET